LETRFRQQFGDEESDSNSDQTESESDDSDEATDEENADDENENDNENEDEDEVESDESDEESSHQFVQLSQAQLAGARMNRQLSSRYDTYGMLPRGQLPWHLARPETAPAAYARASVRPNQIPDAVFQPIHRSMRQFGRAGAPVMSLAAGVNNYAFSRARAQPNWVYGNTNLPVPVNAQFYPPPFAARAAPFRPSPPPPPPPASPLLSMSFAEMSSVNALPPARNPTSDLMASEYHTYSNAQWPSSIAPPAAYYLPPDVVV